MVQRLLLLFISFLAVCATLMAQQGLQFSQFMFNPVVINPAASGNEEAFRATGFHRSQWAGLAGAPVYQSASADLPIYVIGSGAGLMLINDKIGVDNTFAVYGSYAYHRKVGNGVMSAGIQIGWMQKMLDGTLLTTPEGIYEQGVIDHNDNVIPGHKITATSPDLGLGLMYTWRGLMVGLSASHLNAPRFRYAAGVESSIRYNRHFNLAASWHRAITHDWDIFPSILLKTDLVKTQAEANIVATYNEFVSFGAGYRGLGADGLDALVGFLGLQVSTQLMVGYSYDFGISALQNVHNGSHEIHLRYLKPMVPPRKGKIINNPRYLSF